MLNSWTSHLSAITWDSLGDKTKGRCSPIICWRCVGWGGVALFLCLLLCVFGRLSSPLCLVSSQWNVSESEMFHLSKNGKHGSTVSPSARGLSIGSAWGVRTCRADFLFSLPVHIKFSWFRPRMDPNLWRRPPSPPQSSLSYKTLCRRRERSASNQLYLVSLSPCLYVQLSALFYQFIMFTFSCFWESFWEC